MNAQYWRFIRIFAKPLLFVFIFNSFSSSLSPSECVCVSFNLLSFGCRNPLCEGNKSLETAETVSHLESNDFLTWRQPMTHFYLRHFTADKNLARISLFIRKMATNWIMYIMYVFGVNFKPLARCQRCDWHKIHKWPLSTASKMWSLVSVYWIQCFCQDCKHDSCFFVVLSLTRNIMACAFGRTYMQRNLQ